MKLNKRSATLSAAAMISLIAAEQPVLELKTGLRWFETFTAFDAKPGPNEQELILTSPLVNLGFAWNEAILSWNTSAPDSAEFQFEIAPVFEDKPMRFYSLGSWSKANVPMLRKSIQQEFDKIVSVNTDTLVLKQPVTSLRIRLRIRNKQRPKPDWIQFLAVSCTGPRAEASNKSSPNPAAPSPRAGEARAGDTLRSNPKRGRVELQVPALSQLHYPGGQAWCSPTSLTMILNYWGTQLSRSDLHVDVPGTAASVFDPVWGGTGNWPFNTAFAGSFPGMRAWVARFESLSDVETCVRAGIPVVASVSYNQLKGLNKGGSGHLVVCIGFEHNGDPILNDPGTSVEIKQSIPRERFQTAWAESKNTVYLVCPANRLQGLLQSLRTGLHQD